MYRIYGMGLYLYVVLIFTRIASALLDNQAYILKSLTKPYLIRSLIGKIYKYN